MTGRLAKLRCHSLRLAARSAVTLVAVGFVSSALADDAVTLKNKYTEGASFKTTLNVNVDQELTLGEQAVDTEVESTVVTKTEYGQRNDQGKLPVSVTFESLKSSMQLPGGASLEFDSDKPAPESDNPVAQYLVDVLKKQNGMKLTYELSDDNQVQEVRGLPEGSLVGPESMRREFQQAADQFPDEPVKVGDTWKRTTVSDLGNGQLLTVEREFEYLGTVPEFPTLRDARQLEKIRVTAQSVDFSIDPNGGLPIAVKTSDLKIASSDGTILFDRETGRIVSQADEMRIQGDLELEVGGMILGGALDLSFESKATETK